MMKRHINAIVQLLADERRQEADRLWCELMEGDSARNGELAFSIGRNTERRLYWDFAERAYAAALEHNDCRAEWHFRRGLALEYLTFFEPIGKPRNWTPVLQAYENALERDHTVEEYHHRLMLVADRAGSTRGSVDNGDPRNDGASAGATYTPLGNGLRFRDDIALLLRPGGIGIELGVAEGEFSRRILERSQLDHLFSVDMYAGDRGHDTEQYKKAIKNLSDYGHRNTLIRLRFDEAIDMFIDQHFDFIYVDGYAHTGEENGMTIRDWYTKLKPGGIIAGDDYSSRWPEVVAHVNAFASDNNLKLNIVDCRESAPYCGSPTWFVYKPI